MTRNRSGPEFDQEYDLRRVPWCKSFQQSGAVTSDSFPKRMAEIVQRSVFNWISRESPESSFLWTQSSDFQSMTRGPERTRALRQVGWIWLMRRKFQDWHLGSSNSHTSCALVHVGSFHDAKWEIDTKRLPVQRKASPRRTSMALEYSAKKKKDMKNHTMTFIWLFS